MGAINLTPEGREQKGFCASYAPPSVLKFSLDSLLFRPLSSPYPYVYYPPLVYPTRQRTPSGDGETGRDVWSVE